jgi:RNA polymerase sigma-70 factor (ECF subfamily)
MDEKRDELKAFQENPNRATAGLYAGCRPKFLRWGQEHHRAGVHDLADIFQQAVVIMVLNIESGRLTTLTGTLCTYLFGIGKKLIQALIRKQKRLTMPGDENLPLPGENDPGIESQIIKNQEKDRLWAEVDALGEPARSILILTYKEGMNSQEIADVLGYASADVVRQLRKRSLDKMRKP